MASQKASQRSKSTHDLTIEEPLENLRQDSRSLLTSRRRECICPNCGKRHTMNIRWIGRGVPRKFCQSCRDRETSSDFEI
jgi:hypothetical protein